LIQCITKWIKKWKENDWKTMEKKKVKNISDLEQLDLLCTKIKIEWV
jgi:ribonuclease HI